MASSYLLKETGCILIEFVVEILNLLKCACNYLLHMLQSVTEEYISHGGKWYDYRNVQFLVFLLDYSWYLRHFGFIFWFEKNFRENTETRPIWIPCVRIVATFFEGLHSALFCG